MLQAVPKSDESALAKYVSAIAIQESGLDLQALKEMYFEPNETYKLSILAGDVLVVEGGSVGRSAYVVNDLPEVYFQNSINRLRARGGQSVGKFLHFLMVHAVDSGLVELACNKATIMHLTAEKLGQLQLPMPPVEEQRAIADFLDRETAEIDAFIADQERLIELLSERRTATITHAVTKGLDPSAPLRDSGIPWLGHIPTHWQISKVGYHYSVVLGKMLDEKKFNSDHQLRTYLRAGNLSDHGLTLADLKEMTFSDEEVGKYSLEVNDLLVVEGGSIGTNVLISEPTDLLYQKTINRVRGDGTHQPALLGFWLRVLRDSDYLSELCNGSTIMHFTAEKLRALPIPFAPITEQVEILNYLNDRCGEIDALIADAQRAIELSKERRAALISAAVTGQIDVHAHA